MVEPYLCPVDVDLLHAMRVIDRNGQGLACFHDADNVIVGIMTDGDIRRTLLKGISPDSPVREHINSNFFWMPENVDEKEYKRALLKKRHILILDADKRLVSVKTYKENSVIPVSSPSLDGNELQYLTQCIQTNWISSQGKFVQQFESMFAEYLNVAYALSASNGTAALHLALLGLHISAGDEVIVPVSTFGASANAVIHCGAVPVFVDIESDTWCIDCDLIEKAITPRTRAIMPVHLYGHPASMARISSIAQSYGLKIVEDCAESLGATFEGKLTGTMSDAACFSFFSNKVITTGEGGMIATDDKETFQRMRQYRDHGVSPSRKYWHDFPGYNYRLTNLQSAIGVAQLERIDYFLEARRRIARQYSERLAGLKGLKLPQTASGCTNIHWLYTIEITEAFPMTRDALIEKLQRQNIDSRPFFPALFHQPAYKPYLRNSDFPVAKRLEQRGLSLPTGNDLTVANINRVCDALWQLASS